MDRLIDSQAGGLGFCSCLSDFEAEPSHDSAGRTGKVFQWQQRRFLFFLSARGTTAPPALQFFFPCCHSVLQNERGGGFFLGWPPTNKLDSSEERRLRFGSARL